MMSQDKTRLGVCCFGVAIGVCKALFILVIGLVAYMHGSWGASMVSMMGSLFPGYSGDSLAGILTGTLWGLFVGFISGVIIAVVYNTMLHLCCHCCKKSDKCE